VTLDNQLNEVQQLNLFDIDSSIFAFKNRDGGSKSISLDLQCVDAAGFVV